MSSYLPGLDDGTTVDASSLNDPAVLARIRAVAQSDPAPKLVARWGEATADVRLVLAKLVVHLRELDALKEQLGERDITVDINLGPIGNAAAAARRDLEKRSDRPQFEMPR